MPKKAILPVIILIALSLQSTVDAQNSDNLFPQLSEQAKISLMTCGPGEAIYTLYGHSALRVNDPIVGIDKIYNYGTFDFDTPNFVLKFMKGKLLYKLSVVPFRYFLAEYINENRSVTEQILNLNQEQKQKLFEAIETDYLPENRYYLYDFFHLNCSSILRDRVFEATDQSFKLPDSNENATYRSIMQPYLEANVWIKEGINLLLAHPSDAKAGLWEQMYLPDYMLNAFIKAKNSRAESLVLSEKQWYKSTNSALHKSWISSNAANLAALALVLLVLITRWGERNSKKYFWIDAIVFSFAGIIGMIISFMWFFSVHEATSYNINLIWAHPFMLLIPILIWFRSPRKLIRQFAGFNAIFGFLILILNIFINYQEMNLFAVCLAAMVLSRLAILSGFLAPLNQK